MVIVFDYFVHFDYFSSFVASDVIPFTKIHATVKAWEHPDRDRGNHRALELPLQRPKKLVTVAIIFKISMTTC
jgi:hypothetical protein